MIIFFHWLSSLKRIKIMNMNLYNSMYLKSFESLSWKDSRFNSEMTKECMKRHLHLRKIDISDSSSNWNRNHRPNIESISVDLIIYHTIEDTYTMNVVNFFRVISISSNFGSLVSNRRILTVNFLSIRSIISRWNRRDRVRRTPSMSLWFQDSPESDFVTKNPFTSIQFNRSSSISSSGFNCSFFIDCEFQYHYSSYCADCAYTFLIWVQSRDNAIPYPNVICSVATISCPMSFDFVLSFFFCSRSFS